MSAHTSHVKTMRDILSALQKSLGRLPADVNVHSAQRAAKVFDQQLEKLEVKLPK